MGTDRETRRFIREARQEARLLIQGAPEPEPELTDEEMEVMMRAGMGGTANLGFFLPYLWRHRHTS